MGIVNVTPDSFSGDGVLAHQAAIAHAHDLLAQGADLLDIGGVSTRPGAQAVTAREEWQRIAPVLTALRDAGVPLSIDTSTPEVMHRALDAGADMINDVTAFRQPKALQVVAGASCALCVMHMQGEPRTMQQHPHYQNVVTEVVQFLQARVDALRAHGVDAQRMVIDPGFGFGKTVQHNYQLLQQLETFHRIGLPVLVGLSRKSMLGAVVNRPAAQRVNASVAAALAAVARGAQVLRVHDVAATCDALAVWHAVTHPAESTTV